MNKTTLTFLLASAALTSAVVLPAWSAMTAEREAGAKTPLASIFSSGNIDRPLRVAESGDEDGEGAALAGRPGENDEDSCEEDDGNCGSTVPAPAPAGSVAPPQNGLFGTMPPQVQVK